MSAVLADPVHVGPDQDPTSYAGLPWIRRKGPDPDPDPKLFASGGVTVRPRNLVMFSQKIFKVPYLLKSEQLPPCHFIIITFAVNFQILTCFIVSFSVVYPELFVQNQGLGFKNILDPYSVC